MEQPLAPAPPFEAVLYPNPPLGRMGYFVLTLAVAVVSAGLGAAFAFAGAWPVTGFLGLDVLLLWLAFRTCRRRSRCAELIRLDRSGLHVCRIGANGRRANWRFEPFWVRVEMDDPPRPDSTLVLSAQGRHVRLGEFLTVAERVDLARALRCALTAYR